MIEGRFVMKPSNKISRARMASAGRTLTTFGLAAAVVGAITIVPPSDPPPRRAMPAVDLTAAYLPLAVRQQLQELRAGAVIAPQQLNSAAPVPTASRPTLPTPPTIPPPVVTAFEFEDAIINTYHAIEPWVRYGFELGTYVVGWVPWVGWLAPQIMIFYNFGERIVESLVVNSANWLWGPLPFGEGLANVARDSWDALVQLGRDEWNFWLPPLPPLPFSAEQTADPTPAGGPGTVDEPAAPSAGRPHPVRDALLALVHRMPALDSDAAPPTERTRWFDHSAKQAAITETESSAPVDEAEGQRAPADSVDDSTTPTGGDTGNGPQQPGGESESAEKPSRQPTDVSEPTASTAGESSSHTPRGRDVRKAERRGLQFRQERREAHDTADAGAA